MNREKRKCLVCSEKFIPDKSCKYKASEENNVGKFCSSNCSASYNNKIYKKKPDKYCLNCKSVLTDRRAKYCNNDCQQIFQTNERILNNNFSFKTAKKYLILKDNSCSVCRMKAVWQGKKLVMVLDHIDGNAENNELLNFRLVCPNCNSQLPTFAGRNKGNGRPKRRAMYRKVGAVNRN